MREGGKLKYIINRKTQAITGINSGYYRTKIYEVDRILYVTETPLSIIENSCISYGSSLTGRQAFVKQVVEVNSKLPIPIKPRFGLFFLPTKSYRNGTCIWFSYYHVNRYMEHNNKLIVILKNNKMISVDVSFNQFDLQMKRTSQVIAYFYQLIYCFENNKYEQNIIKNPKTLS